MVHIHHFYIGTGMVLTGSVVAFNPQFVQSIAAFFNTTFSYLMAVAHTTIVIGIPIALHDAVLEFNLWRLRVKKDFKSKMKTFEHEVNKLEKKIGLRK